MPAILRTASSSSSHSRRPTRSVLLDVRLSVKLHHEDVILAAVCGAVCQGHAPSRPKVVCSYDGVNSIRVITVILVGKVCKSAAAASLSAAASGAVEQAGVGMHTGRFYHDDSDHVQWSVKLFRCCFLIER